MTVTSVRFACESCRRELEARAEAAGRRVRCPGCGDRTLVRSPAGAAPVGVRVRWPWFAAAAALVVIAGVSGLGVGAAVGKWSRPGQTTTGATPVATDPPRDTKATPTPVPPVPVREPDNTAEATTGTDATPAAKTDPDLQGTWRLVEVYDRLEPGTQRYISVSSFYQVTVRDGEQVVESDGSGTRTTTRYGLKTNPSRSPRAYRRTGPDSKEYVGIYKIDGNELMMCSQKGDQLPDGFAVRPDDGKGRTIMEFERVK